MARGAVGQRAAEHLQHLLSGEQRIAPSRPARIRRSLLPLPGHEAGLPKATHRPDSIGGSRSGFLVKTNKRCNNYCGEAFNKFAFWCGRSPYAVSWRPEPAAGSAESRPLGQDGSGDRPADAGDFRVALGDEETKRIKRQTAAVEASLDVGSSTRVTYPEAV